jgi:hypothetical protein
VKHTFALRFVLAQAVNALAFSAGAQDLRGMATSEAMAVFDDVCGQTLPNFNTAEAKAKALGFAFNEEDSVKDLTIKVQVSTSGVPFCTVSFGTNEQIPQIVRQLQVGFDFVAGDPESYRKPPPGPQSISFEDGGYKDTDYSARMFVSRERKFGRFGVSMALWGKK